MHVSHLALEFGLGLGLAGEKPFKAAPRCRRSLCRDTTGEGLRISRIRGPYESLT